MGKITELPADGHGHGPAGSKNIARDQDADAILTQAEREQVLFQSGVLEKLGLPPDYVTLQDAQRQLESHKTKNKNKKAPLHPEWGTDSDSDAESQDDYGHPSDDDQDDDRDPDDNAERLMQSQATSPLESVLDLLIWTMPFGFLYTLLDVLVHQQYGQTITFLDELGRLIGSIPLLGAFIWWNLHSPNHRLLELVHFALSSLCGSALVYIVNRSTFDIVMRRVPPLGTLWIFAVVRMDLMPACVSLALVAIYVQCAGLRIMFD